ncbi:hypothetical protein HanXRQr2_Chr08g0352481 [Helianthus annuus]|uniref:Uncharacterized protein n=1 Tax=Helianthus annuus TaxID=4232 RepID=A0A9K3NDS2_HELAN|nr:hypothetical protein HanXRQr2_Chr08g0352481 [Helianthus annuus]KAJ0902720.1 hypothetical protein HanPSC8_Chr08g0340421 [Helianthus annuus]
MLNIELEQSSNTTSKTFKPDRNDGLKKKPPPRGSKHVQTFEPPS